MDASQNTLDARDDEFTEENSTISKPRSFPGTAPRFHQLYQPPQAKVCYFYKDNDQTFRGLKLTVNKKYYNNVEVLKRELTKKVPGLPFGVRSIYTPSGRHSVAAVDNLEHQGHYVCSTYAKKARGVDILRLQEPKPWHGGRAPSGRRRYNATLRDPTDIQSLESPRRARAAWVPHRDTDSGPFPSRPKKVTLIDMERPTTKHILLLNRRTAQSFEQILDDISQMFQMPCRKLFTIDGRPVRSLSAILHGPEIYLVTDGEHFKPNTSMSEPLPHRKRTLYGGRHNASERLREKRERLSKTRGKWTVWVTTNELPSAGTQAQVSITVYGHKGNSGPIPLGYVDGQTFQAGNVDEFEISVGNIGEIYKIRIGHDNTGEFPGWFLDEVRMQDGHTREELIFKCQRWLSRDEEDGEICRELPAVRANEQILPVIIYEVTTVTGDLWNAGTQANVYITLYGERGDTGVRQLFKSSREKFKKDQTDVFTVEAVSLGQLKRAIIGHDGANAGEGWYLEKLVVRALDSAQTKQPLEWTFFCKKWLDVGEDDGKIVRELKPQNSYNQDVIEKQVFEFERWKYGADCVVMLYSKVTQKPVRIKPDSGVDCAGEYKDELGQFLVIPRNGLIRIFRSVVNNRYHLAIDNGKTIGKGKGGSYCEFKVRTQEDRSIILESVKYFGQQLTVHPSGRMGDPRGHSGDPTKQFHVYCKGITRDKGIIVLCTSLSQTMRINNDSTLYATGRRDKLAHFRVHKVREGGIRMFESMVFQGQYICLREGQVDCRGTGDHYCEFKVDKVRDQGYITIESSSNRGLFLGMTPEGKIRPVVNTGDRNVRFYPEVVEFGIPKRRTLSPVPDSPQIPLPSKPAKVQRQRKQRSPTPPPPRERTPTPVFITKDEEQKEKSTFKEGDWKVFVTTDETNDGGDVIMVVYGDKGNSGPIVLGKATDSGLFAAGNLDEFKVNLSTVGKLYKIRMELHASSARKEPSWKIKEVKMKDMTTNETLKFKFNRWLSKNHDDGATMRELGAVRPKQKVPKLLMYQIHVYTGSENGADTDANVYINLFGELGDTGKRLLHRSDQKVKFQEGQVDKFELEAVHLGKLKRCVISHDGEGAGEGWFCEQVIVRESEDADKEYVFPCNRWLDSSIDDHKIERVLKIKERHSALIQTEN